MKQLVYHGYTIVEKGAYVEIYKGDSYIKRIQSLGHSTNRRKLAPTRE